MKKPKTKKPRDYHAKLVLYGAPKLTKKQWQRVIDWVQSIYESIGEEEYGPVATWRLMK